MHSDDLASHRHSHDFVTASKHENRTRWVVVLTAGMMVLELVVGTLTHSMALLADGWHMATHAGALGLAAVAYWFARTRSSHGAFSFGTGKVYALAGYTNAIVLAVVALLMMAESARRLFQPEAIRFDQALPVAIVGLLVNLASVKLLHVGGGDHDHGHDHDHEHEHEEDHHDHDHEAHHDHDAAHHDHNLRSAYMHVLADALTSVLAIVALLGGRYFGLRFLDPLMGILGGVVILRWSWSLCRGAARQLLDMVPKGEVGAAIRKRVEAVGDARVSDLHVWELGPGQNGCIVSLVSGAPREVEDYRRAIEEVASLAHLTVEVRRCPDHAAGAHD